MPGARAAEFNKRYLNRFTLRIFPKLPGFGVVNHRGRKSGHVYRTPVNVFRDGADFIIALTYGPNSEWVKNVVAADECELEHRGMRFELTGPEPFEDPDRRYIRALERQILKMNHTNNFLRLHQKKLA